MNKNYFIKLKNGFSLFSTHSKNQKPLFSFLPLYKTNLKLQKVLLKFKKSPEISNIADVKALKEENQTLERNFLLMIKELNQSNFSLFLKTIHKEKLQINDLSQKEKVLSILERFIEEKLTLNVEEIFKMVVKYNILAILPNNHLLFNRIISLLFKKREITYDYCLCKLSYHKRLKFYKKILKKQSKTLGILFIKTSTFENDLQKSLENPKFPHFSSFYHGFFLLELQKLIPKVFSNLEKALLTHYRGFSKKKLVYLIVFNELFQKDLSIKKEFYFNLRLIREKENNSEFPILSITNLMKIQGKIKKRFDFFDEELELIVKRLLETKKFNLKQLKSLAKLLNNEYYVFQYYKTFVNTIKHWILYDKSLVFTKITDLSRVISILNRLKIRFPLYYIENHLNPFPLFIKDYFLLYHLKAFFNLILTNEKTRENYLFLAFNSINRLKALEFDPDFLQNTQLSLLISALFHYKATFNDKNGVILKTLTEIAQNHYSLSKSNRKSFFFFLFNAIPLLKAHYPENPLLAFCESTEKALIYPQKALKPIKNLLNTPEKAVFLQLKKEINIVIEFNHQIGPYTVDFFIKNRAFIIEYHGLQHFYLEDKPIKDLLHRDLIKKEVLGLLGYKYVIISCWIWKRLRTESDKSTFIQDLVRKEKEFHYNQGTVRKIPNLKKL